jgi:hypothetical protein
MKIIPSDKIDFEIPHANQEVRKFLNNSIRPKRSIVTRIKKKEEKEIFEGIFRNDEFKIQRITNGRNSFIPQIKGKIYKHNNRTRLTADLKVRRFTKIFMLIWIVFLGLALIMGIIGVLQQGTNPLLLIFPLIMIAFAFGLVHYGFNKEKENSINELKKMVSGL